MTPKEIHRMSTEFEVLVLKRRSGVVSKPEFLTQLRQMAVKLLDAVAADLESEQYDREMGLALAGQVRQFLKGLDK
jgi:uncharacterized protein YciW